MNQTTVIAVGTMISPAKLRRTTDGTAVANFRMACNERRRDRETGEWGDGDSFYVTVTCWRRLAENLCSSLRSGDPIVVRGRLSTREYEVEGRRNSVTEMEADVVAPDLTRCTAGVIRTPRITVPVPAQANGATADPWAPVIPDGAAASGIVAESDRERAEAVPAAGH